jgi:hypothetical protein
MIAQGIPLHHYERFENSTKREWIGSALR